MLHWTDVTVSNATSHEKFHLKDISASMYKFDRRLKKQTLADE